MGEGRRVLTREGRLFEIPAHRRGAYSRGGGGHLFEDLRYTQYI